MNNHLQHYGVKGMKWGRRKGRSGGNRRRRRKTSKRVNKSKIANMLKKKASDVANSKEVKHGVKVATTVVKATGKIYAGMIFRSKVAPVVFAAMTGTIGGSDKDLFTRLRNE